jgi:hypothetical protein
MLKPLLGVSLHRLICVTEEVSLTKWKSGVSLTVYRLPTRWVMAGSRRTCRSRGTCGCKASVVWGARARKQRASFAMQNTEVDWAAKRDTEPSPLKKRQEPCPEEGINWQSITVIQLIRVRLHCGHGTVKTSYFCLLLPLPSSLFLPTSRNKMHGDCLVSGLKAGPPGKRSSILGRRRGFAFTPTVQMAQG